MAFKSLLTASVLGVIGVVASNNAFATDQSSTFCKPGFYTGIQGGRSDTFYSGKKFFQTAAPVSDVQTHTKGIFDFTDTMGTSEQISTQKVDDIGIGGRIYAGYQFNPYFALEAGYTQYAKTTFSANTMTTTTADESYSYDIVGPETVHVFNDKKTSSYHHFGEITENAVDLVGKATLPLSHGFGLYAKAGAAYINAGKRINSTRFAQDDTRQTFSPPPSVTTKTTNNTKTTITESTKSYQALRPTAGIGINYSIPHSNISLDGSYSRVFSSGAIPQASLLALGVEYKFN